MTTSDVELAKFEKLGAMWRDPKGPMRVLHVINPMRTRWIAELVARHHPAKSIIGLDVLDVGCGAGLLAESLSDLQARVTGIDPVARNIRLAKDAAEKAHQTIEYRAVTPDVLRGERRTFDVVCAMEVVEHVPDRDAFLELLSDLVRPDGVLIISTIDRTALSWLVAIVGAEKILRILPAGTHRWDWFVRPDEATRILGRRGLRRIELRGLKYLPLFHRATWTTSTRVNWLGAWRR